MSRMTASCLNCGTPKTLATLADLYCTDCMSAVAGAEAAASAENRDPSAARRAALAQRAHTANRNFTDPRVIDRRTVWLNANKPTAESGQAT